jgi:hypothetical protein
VVLVACPSPRQSTASESPVSALDAGARSDAGLLLPPLAFRLGVELADGGWLSFDAASSLAHAPPAVALELSSPLELVGARVRLFDWSDSVVPGDDMVTSGDGGFQARIRPLRALEAGRAYELVVDGEIDTTFSDTFGRQHADVRLRLQIDGDVQPTRTQVRPSRKKPLQP